MRGNAKITVLLVFLFFLAILYLIGANREESVSLDRSSPSNESNKNATIESNASVRSIVSNVGEQPAFAGVTCGNGVCSTASCAVDYSKSSRMQFLAPQVAKLCEDNYPKIMQMLNNTLPQPHRIIFEKNQTMPGIAAGAVIRLGSDWFAQHPDDTGAVIHEMAHAVQAYPSYSPSWLIEGIADAIRYKLGFQNSWSYPHCGQGSENYTSGYWCAAAFLGYLEKTYDAEIVARLNGALRQGNYSDNLFESYTNKTLEELWGECKQNDCKGGSP